MITMTLTMKMTMHITADHLFTTGLSRKLVDPGAWDVPESETTHSVLTTHDCQRNHAANVLRGVEARFPCYSPEVCT